MKDEFARGMRSLTPEESKELKKYYESLSNKIDFAPVVHAKWEWSSYEDGYVCSNCGHWCAGTPFEGASFLTPYCPFCGAKMDKE